MVADMWSRQPEQKLRGSVSHLSHQAASRLEEGQGHRLSQRVFFQPESTSQPAFTAFTAFTASPNGTTQSGPRLTHKSHGDIAHSSHHRGCRVTIVVMAVLRLSLSISDVCISGKHNELTPVHTLWVFKGLYCVPIETSEFSGSSHSLVPPLAH